MADAILRGIEKGIWIELTTIKTGARGVGRTTDGRVFWAVTIIDAILREIKELIHIELIIIKTGPRGVGRTAGGRVDRRSPETLAITMADRINLALATSNVRVYQLPPLVAGVEGPACGGPDSEEEVRAGEYGEFLGLLEEGRVPLRERHAPLLQLGDHCLQNVYGGAR